MERRKFVKDAGFSVLGIGAFGSISWKDDRFIGDSPTTTDILGPFYRPGAPMRTNLNPAGFNGALLDLSGTLFKDDGKTPLSDCLIEVWQCEGNGFYDNISDEFQYRASQKTKGNGQYHFITTLPVPEPVDEKLIVFRPAHIHLRISRDGYQDLITQIYFQGDPYLDTDPSTKSGLALSRILPVRKIDDKKSEIYFDIALGKEYLPDDSAFRKVSGVYKMDNGTMMEFYRSGDLLFYKTNNQIWGGLAYTGNNTFGGQEDDTQARFELQPKGAAKVWFRFSRRKDTRLTGLKVLAYKAK